MVGETAGDGSLQGVADDRVDQFVRAVFDQEAEPQRGPRVPFPPAHADFGPPDRMRPAVAEAPPPEVMERERAMLAEAEDDSVRAPGDVAGLDVLHREHLRFDVGRDFAGRGDEGGPRVRTARQLAFSRVNRAFDPVRGDERPFDRLPPRVEEAPVAVGVDRVGVGKVGFVGAAKAPVEAKVGVEDVAFLTSKLTGRPAEVVATQPPSTGTTPSAPAAEAPLGIKRIPRNGAQRLKRIMMQ